MDPDAAVDNSKAFILPPKAYSAPPPDKDKESPSRPRRRRAMDKPAHNVLVRTLTLNDVDACVELENSTFSEAERATREKFIYRLTVCPELSLGMFTNSAMPASDDPSSAKYDRTGARELLIAHLLATKIMAETVTDGAMQIPEPFDLETRRYKAGAERKAGVGHEEAGQTIGIHSLAVSPEYQGNGYGTILLRDYISRMTNAAHAERLALLAHDHMVPFYERFGFKNTGPSNSQYGGGNWFDMVLSIQQEADSD